MSTTTEISSKVCLAPLAAEAISQHSKEKFLLARDEKDFRDRVVIPVFKRMGLELLRDTHGNDEEGKD